MSSGSPLREPMLQRFGDKLRDLRQRHQLTQAALARLLPPTTRGHINNIEVGRKEPSLDFVVRVATLFQLRVDDLVRDEIALPSEGSQALGDGGGASRQQLGAKLRYLRVRRGITQVALAQQLGLQTQAHISLVENGQSDVSLDLALRLAEALSVSVDYLVRDSIPVEEEGEAD